MTSQPRCAQTSKAMRSSLFIASVIVLLVSASAVSTLSAQRSEAPSSSGTASAVSPVVPIGPESGAGPVMFSSNGRYRITPGDVLDIAFPYVAEFNQTVSVQPDGYIALRGVGEVRVEGRTVSELRAELTEAYESILLNPEISIVLKEFEKPFFYASGAVSHPGKYELRSATTVTQALALAGGLTTAAKQQVLLFRRFSSDLVEVKEINVQQMYAKRDLSEDYLLRPGDTVFIPTSTWSKVLPFLPKPTVGLYFNPFP